MNPFLLDIVELPHILQYVTIDVVSTIENEVVVKIEQLAATPWSRSSIIALRRLKSLPSQFGGIEEPNSRALIDHLPRLIYTAKDGNANIERASCVLLTRRRYLGVFLIWHRRDQSIVWLWLVRRCQGDGVNIRAGQLPSRRFATENEGLVADY